MSLEDKKIAARAALENLEIWLRRLIDQELTDLIGNDYLTQLAHKDNVFQFSYKTAERILSERKSPEYLIEGTYLDDIIKIISNEHFYQKKFSKVFKGYFVNKEHLQLTLKQLIGPRNEISHSRHVSNRNIEKILCYSNDTIDAIKEHYKTINMDKEYNVPLILQYKDSLGNCKSFGN